MQKITIAMILIVVLTASCSLFDRKEKESPSSNPLSTTADSSGSRSLNTPSEAATQVTYYESGDVKSEVPSRDIKIDGIIFKANKPVEYYENGQVKSGYLTKVTRIDGVPYSHLAMVEKDGVDLGDKGTSAVVNNFMSQLNKAGMTTNKYIHYEWVEYPLTFHENGQVSKGFLATKTRIKGLLVVNINYTWFHENGSVSIGFLGEDSTFNGKKVDKYDLVYLNPDGSLIKSVENPRTYQD